MVHLETLSDRHDTIELLIAAPETIDALRAAMIKVMMSFMGLIQQPLLLYWWGLKSTGRGPDQQKKPPTAALVYLI